MAWSLVGAALLLVGAACAEDDRAQVSEASRPDEGANGPTTTPLAAGPDAPPVDSVVTVPIPDDAGAAVFALDPAHPPEPSSTELHLWVSELACAGGASPASTRMVGPDVIETDSSITVTVYVRLPEPLEDGHYRTCPAPVPTYLTVPLDAPIGGRSVLDGTTEPPSPLEVHHWGV